MTDSFFFFFQLSVCVQRYRVYAVLCLCSLCGRGRVLQATDKYGSSGFGNESSFVLMWFS